MKTHYLTMSPNIEGIARDIHHAMDWRRAIFDDVTEDGRRLTWLRLEDGEQGPTFGLYGDIYFCLAGQNRGRDDGLFIFRVEDANVRPPHRVPMKYEAEFKLIQGTTLPGEQGDPLLPHILGSDNETATPKISESIRVPARPKKSIEQPGDDYDFTTAEGVSAAYEAIPLGETLDHALRVDVREMLEIWRPRVDERYGGNPIDFLEDFQRCWTRFNLKQRVASTPAIRIRNILIGQFSPKAVSREEFEEISKIFGLDTIRRHVEANSADRLGIQRFLKLFGALPLPESLRISFWRQWAGQLPVTQFKRELQGACKNLSELSMQDERLKVWGEGIRDAVGLVAREQQDGSIIELYRAIDGVTNPLAEVQEWVARLEFRDDAAARSVDSTPDKEVTAAIVHGKEDESPSANEPFLADLEAVERWILNQTVGDLERTKDVLTIARTRLEKTAQAMMNVASTKDLLAVIELLSVLHRSTAEWMEQLPEHTALEEIARDSREIYDRAVAVLGKESSEAFVEAHSPSSDDLREGLELWESSQESLQRLPEWLAGPATENAEHGLVFRWLAFLLNPDQRRGMFSLFKELQRADQEEESVDLTMIRRPESLETLGENDRWAHFDQEFQRVRLYARFIGTSREDFRPWIDAACERGETAQKIKDMAEVLEKLEHHIAPTTFSEILDRVGRGCEMDGIERLLQAALKIKEIFAAEVVNQPLSQLDHYVSTMLSKSSTLTERSEVDAEISFRHDWVGAHGSRATLVYHQEGGHWWTSVPVLASSPRKKDCPLALSIDLLHGTDGKWPPYNVGPLPVQLRIKAGQWEENPLGDGFVFPFELRLPFRKQPSTYLELSIQALDVETEAVMGAVERLKWESFSPKPFEPITLDWATTGKTDYVEQHPIGTQRRRVDILKRLKAHQSVAVIAPRRFGKTTLVKYIQAAGEEQELLVPEYIACTSYQSTYDSELDYRGIWQAFSDQLEERLGSTIKLAGDGKLPEENGFDFVRRAAKKEGYEAIVFLFDEAQLFFPRHGGATLGDQLKDRLERGWATGTEEMVPVVFVLCGLSDFPDRVPNLMGALQCFEEDSVSEQELYSLILNRTGKRLESTRAARKMLSDSVPNMYVLRTVMEKLLELVNQEQRSWFNLIDVWRVKDDLLHDLQDARGGQLARYVRDCINEAETVNEWKPKREYPVALALAEARKNTMAVGSELIEKLVQKLNEWARVFSKNELSSLKYDSETVREHVLALTQAKILHGYDFTTEFFRAWLLGVVNQGVDLDEGFSDALVRGALVHIRKPEVAIEVSGGSQASIYRFSRDGIDYAYRENHVEDARERHGFIHNLKILHRLLMDADSDEGKAYIYRLDSVGLADEHPERVVEVYRWVDGRDLHGVTTLAPPLVADLGYRLAKALRLIHKANILHRDIRPRNLILDSQRKQPVLIDFGLARQVDATGHTTIPDSFAALEVRQGKPEWTPAADVYSVGATLRSLVSGLNEVPPALDDLLRQCTHEDWSSRPHSRGDDLVKAFEDVKADLKVEARRTKAWDELCLLLASDRKNAWFEGVMQKFRPTLEAHALGLYPERYHQAQVVADFLNQAVEACPARAVASLNNLEKELSGTDSEAIQLVRDLRNLDSHAHERSDRRFQRYSQYSDERLESLSLRAGEFLGERCGLECLPEFVSWMYGVG
ncbi:MAG: protein kinase domain-containing protein [Bradymonadaceae bacterium]